MLAGAEDAEDVAVADHRRDGDDAAAEGLAQQVEVGDDALVLAGEGPAGAAEAGLDLVGDEEDVPLGGQFADPAQVAAWGTRTPASPWIGSSSTATVSSVRAASSASASP